MVNAFLFCFLAAQAPATVTTVVNADKVRVGEEFQVDINVDIFSSADPRSIDIPSLVGMKIVRKEQSGVRSYSSVVNGVASYKKSFTYHLVVEATEAGKRIFPVVTVMVGTYRATSKALPLTIIDDDSADYAPGSSSALAPALRFTGKKVPELFADVRFAEDSVWQGEQVNLFIQVFSTSLVDLASDIEIDTPPGFTMAKLDQEARVRPTERVVGGKHYYVFRYATLALFADGPGPKVFPPLHVQVRTGQRYRRRLVSLRSEAVTLDVRPLPTRGRPAGFRATNVGYFRLHAEVDHKRTTAEEPITFRLRLSGEGRATDVTMPNIQEAFPKARVFPPTTSEKSALISGVVTSQKLVEVLLQPLEAGSFQIPSFAVPFFDPAAGEYRMARSKPINIAVGAKTDAAAASTTRTIRRDARPIHRNLDPSKGKGPLSTSAAFALGTLALFASGSAAWLWAFLWKRRRRSLAFQKRQAQKRREERMRSALERHDLSEVESVLEEALRERFSLPQGTAGTKQILAAITDAGLRERLSNWWTAADAARYGGALSHKRALFAEAASIIEALS